jgi:hypothetical protein
VRRENAECRAETANRRGRPEQRKAEVRRQNVEWRNLKPLGGTQGPSAWLFHRLRAWLSRAVRALHSRGFSHLLSLIITYYHLLSTIIGYYRLLSPGAKKIIPKSLF